MLDRLKQLFRKPAPEPEPDPANQITPEYIEGLIDEAGREDVFAVMRANGWGGHMRQPLWVWNVACQEILASKQSQCRETG